MANAASKARRWTDHLAYDLFLWIFTIVVDLFFREIHPRSTWRIPKTGPILFVAAPHANQFIDPLLLMRTVKQDAKRRVCFLIAEKSIHRPVIGFFSKLIGAVPVGRAMDSKKPAEGKIYLPDPEGDPTLLKGNGTDFTNEKVFMPGGLLVLPSVDNTAASTEIKEILGPTELRLKKAFKGDVAYKQLTGRPLDQANGQTEKVTEKFEGISFQVAPHVNQSKVYEKVFDEIEQGGCVGIFPEGGSHDRTELLPLKGGVAVMALGALEKDPKCGVVIVPVGMNYFHAHKFRSRAVIEFGAPISIDPELVLQYKEGDRRTAIAKVLELVYERLTAVTTLAPDYDTLMLIQAVRRLYNPKGKRLPLSAVVELNRRLIKGYNTYKDDPRIVSLRTQVLDYNRTLFRIGLRDHQVSYAKFSWYRVWATLIYRVAKLLVLTIAVLPGVVLFSPVFITGKSISHAKAKEALAASTVKIRARDVIATWKVLVALALTPTLDFIYTVILTYWVSANRIGGRVPTWIPLWAVFFGGLFFFPAICFMALRFGEIGMDIFKSLRPLILSISPSSKNTLLKLRIRRQELQDQINNIINELGPELFPDFDKRRIIPDPEEAPESPDPPRTPSHAKSDGELEVTPSPQLKRLKTDLPRNESFANIGTVGIFASRPGTPSRSRSRTNSEDGRENFRSGFGFSPINRGDTGQQDRDMDEVSKTLRAQMRERSKRRKSETDGGWEMADGEGDSTDAGVMTPSSDFEPEEAKKDL
ncbi:hypothetical protein BAUCODRAFT_32226 [Baudoinia panamericana UAMH 10762]|uniref:Phospholipid/glycerol acyltransferase domain-containing protein n=1 Tax=Baudoinia panamericana (strain UAMH 10762) TaxID=717646 RepID=M2NG21_BAUPA|nr:uncharacterized protein BAUCODRAFT_32226 [Baudoinia panamericana UAMH 10762]EMC98239.1 hypothetical protein BAUCODRAFT_32226 [Baudoinia panamericana UAMH 10762]